MTVQDSPRLAQARAAHQDALKRMHDAANEYENLPDGTSDEDAEKASQEFDTAQAETERAKSDVDKLERVARARADAPLPVDSSPEEKRHAGEVTTKEPLTYRKDNAMSQHYFRDLAKSDRGDHKAAERIQRHGREVEAERRDITRVDGAGGEFVPPLWLIDKYFDIARPARTTADLVSKMDLPGGTDSINIPRVTTGAAVAIQASDNANINEVDMVTATVNAPVRTIAGQEDVAMQLLDQSPIAFDQIVFKNLATSYAQQLDLQVLAGAGTLGTLLGIQTTVGITSVTYVDLSPTVPELYSKLAGAINSVQTTRFLPPTAWVMHPRRWYWMIAALDSQSRPLVVPMAGPAQAFNAIGTGTENKAEGMVGYLLGLPVFVDPSISIVQGAGTEDSIILARFDDAILFEGQPRTRVMFEIGSQTLTARFQLYNYVAFTAGGYPGGIAVVTGTGLIAPTF